MAGTIGSGLPAYPAAASYLCKELQGRGGADGMTVGAQFDLHQAEERSAFSLAPPALSADDRVRRAAWIFFAAAVIAIFALSPNYRLADQPLPGPYAGDFLQEWLGGRIVLDGDPARFYDPAYAQALQHDPALTGFAFDETRYLPIVYPPFYYQLLSPLARLPYLTAVWVWSGLMIATLVVAIVLLQRLAGPNRWRDALPAAALLFAPVLENLNSGQKGAVCLLILTATYALLAKKRTFSAGLVFGLLAFKPQLALVIGLGMLWRREGKFAAGAAVTVAILIGVSLSLGTDVCLQYVQFARGAADYIRASGYDLTKSHTWYGMWTLLCGAGVIAQGLTLVTAGVTIAAGFRRRAMDTPADYFPPLIFAGVLCSPHLFTYDLTILLLPLTLILARANSPTNAADYPQRRARYFAAATFVLVGIAPAVAAATSITPLPLLLGAWLMTDVD